MKELIDAKFLVPETSLVDDLVSRLKLVQPLQLEEFCNFLDSLTSPKLQEAAKVVNKVIKNVGMEEGVDA